MTDPSLGTYTFLPWVRRGLVRSLDVPDDPGANLAARVTLPVGLHVEGAGDVALKVRLHGPGDVTGLDSRQVTRSEPRPGSTNFEANYLATVELARADLPWLFTPARPGAGERLRPWLCLVVVRRQEGVRLFTNPTAPLPVLEIAPPARSADELPDLTQSWAWAHAQIAGLTVGSTPAAILRDRPQRARSRLVCPRRLQPSTAYLACVVPAFAVGVRAGLGLTVDAADEQQLAPAWTGREGPDIVRLPVYYSWEFATGPAGSFETLVRALKPRPLPAEASRPARLDLRAPGAGLPGLEPGTPGAIVGLETALRAPGPDEPPPWPDEARLPFQQGLDRVLTEAPEDTVSPPVYGRAQLGSVPFPGEGQPPGWVRALNLDPRLRVAAAAGTRVVQQRQEELMAAAWEQAGAVRETNTLLRQAQLARELGAVLLERHLRRLSPEELLAVTQSVHARVRVGAGTLADELRASRVPEATTSAAFQRITRAEGPLLRRSQPAEGRNPLRVLAALDRMAGRRPGTPAGMVTLAAAPPPPPSVELRPPASAESIQARLLERLRPETTVLARARAAVEAPPETWARPDPLAPAETGPRFPQPMYEGLRDEAPQLLLPGLANVLPDTVALLETVPRVIEAYMVGLNHEMSRELLWREFPADLSATPFRQFWDVRGQPGDPETLADIPALADWADVPLGEHLRGPAGGGQLVLLIRGELLRRYPTTTVYLASALPDGQVHPTIRLAPMFSGFVPPDVTFLGFPLTEEAAKGTDPAGPGWYFVFEEHPGEPRFGFDEEAGPGTPATPDDLAWAHIPVTPSGNVDVSRPLSGAGPDLQAAWGGDAAGLARLLLQRPFRVAIHAAALLSAPPP